MDHQHDQRQQQQPVSSSAPQVRSRVTVVCAECKRLKLKCDRRTPCGSCLKRDTVCRCVYSSAAADKVDLHSLNNRVIQVETVVSQLSAFVANIPSNFGQSQSHAKAVFTGSALTLPHDIILLWLNQLGLDDDAICPSFHPHQSTLPDRDHENDQGSNLSLPPLTAYQSSPPNASPTLLVNLPTGRYRTLFLDNVQQFFRLRPSFHWPLFRNRVERLFASADETAFDPLSKPKSSFARDVFFGSSSRSPPLSALPQMTTPQPPSTASFFAATAAAFALGALLANKDDLDDYTGNDPSQRQTGASVPKRLSPAYLHALSAQALSVHEASAPLDLDYILACILQVIFHLQGGDPFATPASKNAGGTLLPLVGKTVNIARQLGLSVDPDDVPERYGTTEADIRRAVWWEVFYYDLFVSDVTGHPPFIDNSPFTTLLVEEEGSKFFQLKCQLALLVRSVKRLAPSSDYRLDEAEKLEDEIYSWLSGLPDEWKINADKEPTAQWYPDADGDSIDEYTLSERVRGAQRCELAIGAHQLVLKLYAPFLLSSSSSSSSSSSTSPTSPSTGNNATPPAQAMHGAVNAAHVIVHASRVLWAVWGQYELSAHVKSKASRKAIVAPALFDFCAFERSLVDAAVMCGLAALRQPGTVWARVASDDVGVALDVLSAEGIGRFGEGRRWTGAMAVGEGLGIVEALWKKMGRSTRTKRKHSASPKLNTAPAAAPALATVPQSNSNLNQNANANSTGKDKGKEKEKEKEKEKKTRTRHYPAYGVRIRPGREPLFLRRGSGSATTSPSNDDKTMQPPQPSNPSLLLPPPQISSSSSYNTTIKSSPSSSTEPIFQQQQTAPTSTHQGPTTNSLSLTPSSGGGSEYRFSFPPEEDPALRRPYTVHEIGPAGTPGPTQHLQHHQHPDTSVYAEYTTDGTPQRQSPYVHTLPQVRSSSYVPPPLTTAGPFTNGTGSTLPSPSYGPGSHARLHHHHQQLPQLSTTSHYGASTRSHLQLHEGPAMYLSGSYDAPGPYAGGGGAMASLTSPVNPGTPSEEHMSVYPVKVGHPSSQYHAQGPEGHGLGPASWTASQQQPQPQPTNESYWNTSYPYQ